VARDLPVRRPIVAAIDDSDGRVGILKAGTVIAATSAAATRPSQRRTRTAKALM